MVYQDLDWASSKTMASPAEVLPRYASQGERSKAENINDRTSKHAKTRFLTVSTTYNTIGMTNYKVLWAVKRKFCLLCPVPYAGYQSLLSCLGVIFLISINCKPASPPILNYVGIYTCQLFHRQKAVSNAAALLATKSVQSPGHPSAVLYTTVFPAQYPQRLMLAIILWFRKCEPISQSVLGKSARAAPQDDGSGETPSVISEGMFDRGKNHMRILPNATPSHIHHRHSRLELGHKYLAVLVHRSQHCYSCRCSNSL